MQAVASTLLVFLGGVDSLVAQIPDVIRVGSSVLRGATLTVGTDTVDNYVVTGSNRQLTSTTVRSITLRQDQIEPVYEIRTIHSAPQGDTGVSMMVVRAKDLSLVFHRVKGARDSAAVSASQYHATAWVVLPNQPVRLFDLTLSGPVFGVEGQIPWLFPLLPLTAGYRAVVPHFSQWEGQEAWDSVAVIGVETISVGGQTHEAWKVDLGALGPPGHRMIRWIDRRTRRVLQSVLRGPSPGPEYWSYLR